VPKRPPPARRVLHRLLRPVAGSLVAVETSGKLLALTFDDGPDPASTPELLDALARHGMRATFFLVGSRAARHPELVARIAAEGHEIGNHSWDHPALSILPPREVARQIRRARAALEPHGAALMRPPYGALSLATSLVARALGYRVVTWSVACGDARGADAGTVAARILKAAAPGAIVLLHDTLYSWEDERFRDRGPTIDAVGLLAERLPDWRFVTISELLRAGRPVERVWVSTPPPGYLAGLGTAPAA
jgi:peptidoglycan/xylan/chitin deacetylase (PgdA/CDA1 family)